MERKERYSLLLLAGGKSQRMGKNKAELIYEGSTFIERMIEKARKLGIEEIYISGFTSEKENLHTVMDIYPDRGPLGGLHAGMCSIKTAFCLVLPVDAPKLPQEVLEELMIFHEQKRYGNQGDKEIPLLWEHGDRKEPLIAIYPTAMADEIGQMICEKSAPVFRMLDKWGYECFRREIEEKQIINVNTPELYRQLINGIESEEK